MCNQGIGSWAERRAKRSPNKVAVVYRGYGLTYGELYDRTVRLSRALRAMGIGRGDRVAFLGRNHPAFLESLFATGLIGAIFVPLNVRLAAVELAYCLEDSESDLLIYSPEYEAAVSIAAGAATSVRHRVVLGNPPSEAQSYEPLIAAHSAAPIEEPVSLEDPCMIMYTSGTTGKPKGAVLSHGNVTWNSLNVLVDIDLASDDVTLVVAPLFHTAGLNMTCLPTILKGGTVVLEAAFDPDRALDLIETYHVTFMTGVPTMFDSLTASPRWFNADLSSLRQVNCGGAPVTNSTIQAYLDRGLTFCQGYGMTETAPGALCLPRDMSSAKAGSAGVPHFFTDVRMVDTDGNQVGPGEKGELHVRGPNVMTGYWRRTEETAAAFDGDWFRTGDVAVANDDGFVYIVDRLKNVIISGGENIYPAEVESVLNEHPAVAEAVVIGTVDEKWGEVGRAVVALKSGAIAEEDELLEFLATRLARYKIPKTVVFVVELPHNASGKILRQHVRAEVAQSTIHREESDGCRR